MIASVARNRHSRLQLWLWAQQMPGGHVGLRFMAQQPQDGCCADQGTAHHPSDREAAWTKGAVQAHALATEFVQEKKMSDLNKVMLIGRIGGKPELRKTNSGDPVCRMRVATSHGVQQDGKAERETLWHTVVAFDRLAELCAEHLDKGRLVFVEGALRADSWRDKEGVVHDNREVRAHHVHFLGSRGENQRTSGQQVAA